MATLKIVDSDSGEVVEHEVCRSCGGDGGYDASTDCEVYDDWNTCEECEGNGYVPLGFYDADTFVPERDGFMLND